MRLCFKSSSALILLLSLLAAFISCADEAAASPENTGETGTEAAVSPGEETGGPEYAYPELSLGGKEIFFLNMDAYWGMYVTISPDALTGEVLNDAVYARNRSVEEKFGCVIKDAKIVSKNSFDAVVKAGRNAVLAADGTYDVMYLPINQITALLTEGSFRNLYDLPELRLDESWWDSAYNSAAAIGDKLYFASGDLHLMAYDSTWCIFFNEKILADNGLDMPYDLVRAGSWTLDELTRYCAAAADLNGSASFAWDQNGSAVYGLSTHPHSPDKFVLSAGEKYVRKDSGIPVFSAGSERYYGVIEKLAALLDTADGTSIESDADDFNAGKGGYMYVFANRRSAFLTAEIKAAQLLRDMEDTFGILPFPKYDENQESYRSALMSDLLVMTVPVTNTEAADTAAVVDALCYESSRQVIPVYFDITVSQKGLRNDDSIEMMEIMRSSRDADISAIFAWNNNLVNAVRMKVFKGESSVASDIEKYGGQISADIAELLEAFGIQE